MSYLKFVKCSGLEVLDYETVGVRGFGLLGIETGRYEMEKYALTMVLKNLFIIRFLVDFLKD